MRETMLTFGAPWIERSEVDEVVATMEAGWLGTGPRVAKFERAFADYRRAEHVAAVNSCTAAMHLALIAAGIGPGDEVITTPMTFASTVNVIVHAGATPVLADIDSETMNLDAAAVEAAISPRTRALLPVHMAGRPCDMDALMAVAARHDLIVIEDCAHAIEAEVRGRACGTIGDYGCFSFYSTKNITTGEGGMVVCARAEDAARVKTFALHGMTKDAWKRFSSDGYNHYDIVECGFKYNMMDLQAAIGLHQLERVERGMENREALWGRYDGEFADLPVTLPAPPAPETRHARHLYTLLVDRARAGLSRDEFLAAMTQRKIGVGVHYRSIPELTYYQQRFGWRPEAWPNAFAVGQSTVSLPMAANLTESDASDVIDAVHDVIGRR